MTRAFWLRQLHSWHWISAALSLAGMLLFAVTGITLNHAGSLSASASKQERQATVPAPLQAALQTMAEGSDTPVPAALARWAAEQFSTDLGGLTAEVDADEVYVAVPRPGGEGALRIERVDGRVTYTATSRGWVAYFNDLHKGRNAGAVWFWFIDCMAASCIVFTLTGFALLWMHGRARPFTWPLTGLSLLAPVLIALLFVHG